MKIEEPSSLVQRQLDAYNAKDVEAWLYTYSHDAEQFNLHGERLANPGPADQTLTLISSRAFGAAPRSRAGKG